MRYLFETDRPVADESEKDQFSYVFLKRAYPQYVRWSFMVFDILLSILEYIPMCSTMYLLLFISMRFNIMYYGLREENNVDASTNGINLALGTFQITLPRVHTIFIWLTT